MSHVTKIYINCPIVIIPNFVYVRYFPTVLNVISGNFYETQPPKKYDMNEFPKELYEFKINIDDLDKLKSFPIDEPRKLILYINDPLGKRLFQWYKEKKVL